MFLSPAECFIVGRIAASWATESRDVEPLRHKYKVAVSLLNVVNGVFDEFGLDRPKPPGEWWDRADDIPGDVIWREAADAKRSAERMPDDAGHPGTPAVAIGVSPHEPGTMFVERRDGRICGWRVELPRSGLYGLLLRRMRPLVGLSPQVWLMLHDGPWQKAAYEWGELPEFDPQYPHCPFTPDPPADVAGQLAALAQDGGQTEAFRLGLTSGTVEYELWRFARRAGCQPLLWTTFRKIHIQDAESVIEAYQHAVAVLRSPEAAEAARADHLVAAIYRDAERALMEYEGKLQHILILTMAIMLAHDRVGRASMYLYGRVYDAVE